MELRERLTGFFLGVDASGSLRTAVTFYGGSPKRVSPPPVCLSVCLSRTRLCLSVSLSRTECQREEPSHAITLSYALTGGEFQILLPLVEFVGE